VKDAVLIRQFREEIRKLAEEKADLEIRLSEMESKLKAYQKSTSKNAYLYRHPVASEIVHC
jgi:hypothetical protein